MSENETGRAAEDAAMKRGRKFIKTTPPEPETFEIGRKLAASRAYLIRHPLPSQRRVWRVIDRATGEAISTHAVYEEAVGAAQDAQADHDLQTAWSDLTGLGEDDRRAGGA